MTSVQKRAARTMPLRELTAMTMSSGSPIANISTNLMPAEVIARRRLGWLKRRLAFALIALVALVGLGYTLVAQSTTTAKDDLATAQSETLNLQRRTEAFADVVRIQSSTAQIRGQLTGVMFKDLQWTTLLNNVDRVAPKGVTVTAVAAKLSDDSGGSGGGSTPPVASAVPVVGAVQLSGTARDYKAVAAFVDALGKVKGFVAIDPGAFQNAGGNASFTLKFSFTKAVLGGRFASGAK